LSLEPYYQDDYATVYCGDCRDVLPQLPASSVGAIITDPPYYKVKQEAWDHQWDKPQEFLAWLDSIAQQWQRVLRANGSLYCFASPRMGARVEVLLAERFNVLNNIRWAKPNGRWNGTRKEDLRAYFPDYEAVVFAEHYGADNIAKGEAGYAAKCDELRGFVFEPLRAYLAGECAAAGHTVQTINAAWQAERGASLIQIANSLIAN
jgi:site-specific DNA-methyltransferase (adenine-specific)